MPDEFQLLTKFAKQHRLKTRKDVCVEIIIPGRTGQIYEYGEGLLAVMFMTALPRDQWSDPPTEDEMWGKWQPKTWGNHKRAATAIGMTVVQNGDSEGALAFDPKNREQAKLAIRVARVRPKRQVSPEQLARLTAARDLALNRKNPLENGPYSV